MSDGWAIVDGVEGPLAEARLPVTDLGLQRGWAVFETFRSEDGRLVDLAAHIERLWASCRGALVPPADEAVLVAELERAAKRIPGVGRVRVMLTGSAHRIVTAEALDEGWMYRPVRAIRGVHVDEPVLGGAIKHTSRAAWIVAVARSGVDEVLLVDRNGRFTEGTSSAILAVIDGVLWTAPHDGRILGSTTCNVLLDRARELGIPVRREGPPAQGPWDGLYVASSTRVLAPVVQLDEEALPGWESVGTRLKG